MISDTHQSGRRRDIPWLPVIQFHKEITRRAEEAFFSLPTGHFDSGRWSSLLEFRPTDLAGPWEITLEQIRSEGLRRLIRSDTVETLYLGCCGHQRWHRDENGDWSVDWAPVIYRLIESRLVDQDGAELVPNQAKWEVSPLIFQLLDRKNVAPKRPLEQWLPELLQEASTLATEPGLSLAQAVTNVLSREIPELGEELGKPFPARMPVEAPTAWVLFAPPTTTSQYNRHLMADYEALEAQFAASEANPGGLGLLEDANSDVATDGVDLLPIVGLDDSQRQAVERILAGQPVTVISGPPGCGKSQVVVSTLLNCWAVGTSVLFASNNNKAVDVVRERLGRLESDFPIAIRAGSLEASNLEEAIRRVLNSVADHTSGRRRQVSTRAKQDRLLARNRELQAFLDSQVPQRADQALRSSMKAFAAYREALDTLQRETQARAEELRKLGYDMEPNDVERLIVLPLRSWLEGIPLAEAEINRHRKNARRMSTEQVFEQSQRNRACQLSGLDADSMQSWDWLLSGPTPEGLTSRLDSLRESLGASAERSLEAEHWDGEYDRWRGSESAAEFGRRAAELVTEVRSTVEHFEPTLTELSRLRLEVERCRETLLSRRIPDTVNVEPALLNNWASTWAEEVTSPVGRFDWCPVARRSRRQRRLRRLENELRHVLPAPVWRSVGPLDVEGRSKLSELVEDLQSWYVAKAAWHSLETERQSVEAVFSGLRERASQFPLPEAPANLDAKCWRGFADAVAADTEIARRAAYAWERRESRERYVQRLREAVASFESYASGVPIKEAWLAGAGAGFCEALRNMAREPSPASVIAARKALYAVSASELIAAWERARTHEQRVRNLEIEKSSLPTEEETIIRWWSQRPPHLARTFPTAPRLPTSDDPLFAHLAQCEAWWQEWVGFRDERRQELEARIRQEEEWARQQLVSAQEALPQTSSAADARALVTGSLDGQVMHWPIEKLQAAFASFSPDAIRARIERTDREIQEMAFAAARESWIDKLAEDDDLQATLERLLKRYERNRGRISEEDYPLFQQALSVLPIWITTAQAPQALPLLPGLFDLLVIDEATQCTLTNLLPLVFRAKRIAVIGDREQLPAIPTLTAGAEQALAQRYGIDHWIDMLGHAQNTVYSTFVQCLPRRHSDILYLSEHYRSHPLIIGFSNEHVYRKRLRLRKGPDSGARLPCGPGVFARKVEGSCERGGRNRSWQNRKEAEAVVETISQLRRGSEFVRFSLGVVTPFRAQVELISEILDRDELSRGVVVGTAHRFQGDECDVMVFSPVIAKGITEAAARWVEKPHNLINVAVTRAREALFLVCDLGICRQQQGILGRLAEYVDQVETLRATSLEELDLFSWMVVQGWNPEVHPTIGDIEVDFILRSEGRKLAVEVDGSQHDWTTVADAARDAYLKGKGYLTIRIPARAVRETPAVCIERIEAQLTSAESL